VVLLLAPRLLAPTPDGEGLQLPGGRRLPELCLIKRVTGHPCPTCNLGRSLVLLSRGDVAASRARHRGGLLLYGWIVFQFVARLVMAVIPLPRRWWYADVAASMSTFLVTVAGVLLVSPVL